MEEFPQQEYIVFYSPFYKDTQYGFGRIMEQVGYWRKANQIHNWFVENIQDGIDDCCYHREVTEEDLEKLLSICKKVYESCTMILGSIKTGKTYTENGWVDNVALGKVIIDSSTAEELLPTTCGFFFGSTDYDEYYVEDIANTIEIIQHVLDTTDFETQMVYYISSW